MIRLRAIDIGTVYLGNPVSVMRTLSFIEDEEVFRWG